MILELPGGTEKDSLQRQTSLTGKLQDIPEGGTESCLMVSIPYTYMPPHTNRAEDKVQLVECLPNIHKALGSIPSTR